MPARPFPSRRVVAPLLAAVLAVAGCSRDGDRREGEGGPEASPASRPCSSSTTSAASSSSLPPVPAVLALPPGSTLGSVTTSGPETVVRGQVPASSVSAALPWFQRNVEAAGGTVTKTDDEGEKEAEIIFATPEGRSGVIRLARSSCPAGAVDVVSNLR